MKNMNIIATAFKPWIREFAKANNFVWDDLHELNLAANEEEEFNCHDF